MSQKLLQKRRNKNLQETPPENLMPNRSINKREKARVSGTSYIRMEEELRNKWVLFWNVLQGEIFPQIPISPSGTTQKKNSLTQNQGSPLEKRMNSWKSELQFLLHRWNSVPLVFSERKIVEPFAYILSYQTRRAVGGNIIQILNKFALQDSKKRAYSAGLYCNRNQLVSAVLSNIDQNGIKKLGQHLHASIYWNKRESFVADFLNEQMQRFLYCGLYALHEMNIKRGKIKDLRKNQYTECRKIGILYGNLPKRALIRIMRRAKEGGGNLDCKFLSALERRLDVALKRILFFPTIKSARQWINRGNILVNNCICTIPGYLLQPADLIRIKNKAQTSWRVGWLNHFSQFGNLLREARSFYEPNRSNNLNLYATKNIPKKELIKPFFSKSGSRSEERRRRRFLLSPSLLRQWKEWGLLWGNWSNKKQRCKDNLELHKWGKNSYQWMQFTNNLFESSGLVGYFNENQMAHQRRTAITAWLTRVRIHLLFLAKRRGIKKNFPASFRGVPRKKTSKNTYSIEKARENGIPSKSGAETDRTSIFFRKCVSATALHQQQALVMDGLHAHRWSKVFTKIKTLPQKRKDWRYSCIKPMHFECSYKNGSAIFLYASQKLAWPSSINVFLLRKALL